MTRVTAPLSKLTRSLTSSPSISRPTYLNNASKVAAASTLAHSDAVTEARSSESDHARRSMTTTHRPVVAAVPSPTRVIPLMQTFNFQTSARAEARLDTSTIDYAVLPPSSSLFAEPSTDPFLNVRVPLLPDNYSVDRSQLFGHAVESSDAPLAAPQISVVAANPDNVLPAALTEVEGMGIDGVELKFAHASEAARAEDSEPGMLRDLWKGLVDDVFGERKPIHA